MPLLPLQSGLSIQVLDFEECAVRMLMCNDEPWFVAVDICRVLDIRNSRDAVARLDADERNTVALTDGNRGNPNTNIITESGLYTLILRCDDAIKPGTTAHRFRKWVTAEVIPAIRKTGRYEAVRNGESGGTGEEVVTLLQFVRDACAGWSLDRQIEFGLTARRYAKAMGVVFQTRYDPECGKCFAFPRPVLDEVRRSYQRTALLPDSDAAEFERLLEAIHISHGEAPLTPEMMRGFAKMMKLFPGVFGANTSLESERSAFGKLCARFDHTPFPSGYVLKLRGKNRHRRMRVERADRPALRA